ncbi:hypothetical protein D3C73_1033420 [compost metagenome]
MPAQHHALMVQGQLDQRVVIVGAEKMPGIVGPVLEVDVMECQPQAPIHMLGHLRAAIGAEVEQGAVAHTFERAHLRVQLEVLRRAHRVDHITNQRLAAQTLVGHVALGDEDIRPQPRLHVDKLLGGDQVEVDAWASREKIRQARRQPQVGKRRRAAQGDDRATDVLVADTLDRLGDVGEGKLHRVVERRASGGQLDIAPGSTEQSRTHVLLQLADLPTDRRLGDAQRFGRAGEVLVFGGRHEGLDRAQRRQLDQRLIRLGVLDHGRKVSKARDEHHCTSFIPSENPQPAHVQTSHELSRSL